MYLRGPTSKGKEGEGEESRERKGEGKGREGENDLTQPLSQIPGYATVFLPILGEVTGCRLCSEVAGKSSDYYSVVLQLDTSLELATDIRTPLSTTLLLFTLQFLFTYHDMF